MASDPMGAQPALRRAIVIGAGLAGASACVQLARRGWKLDLIDTHPGPAGAASALPVGMLSPHVTRSPTPLSRLTAIGVPLAQHELQTLVPPGSGWLPCEVDNLGADAGRWPAALVRPAALVAAWLDEARSRAALNCHWSSRVATINRVQSGARQAMWQARSEDGLLLAEAPMIVIAAALGSLGLLRGTDGPASAEDHLPLRAVKGQLSLAALLDSPLSARPMRSQGVFVPCYEDSGLAPGWPTRIWAMGSTYERGQDNCEITAAAHARNAASLSLLNPLAARQMDIELGEGRLLGWSGVRCASLDRLPVVGALPDLELWQGAHRFSGTRRRPPPLREVPRQPGLFTLCALGSRGLSLAALCGQTLARQMDGATDDLPSDLVDALDPARFAWRHARRQAPVAT